MKSLAWKCKMQSVCGSNPSGGHAKDFPQNIKFNECI